MVVVAAVAAVAEVSAVAVVAVAAVADAFYVLAADVVDVLAFEVAALESVPVMPLRCTTVSASEEKIKSDQTSSWQRGSETNSMKRQK